MAGSDVPVNLREALEFLVGRGPEMWLNCTLDLIWIHEEVLEGQSEYSASVTLATSPSTVGSTIGWLRWAIYEVASDGARVYVDEGQKGRSPLSLERLESLLVPSGGA